MPKLKFRPISHSWVARHPQPEGVVQFVGGAFFGTFGPTLFYRHLVNYFYDKAYTIVILPFSFSFNHYRESFFLIREQYALLPELVARAIADGGDPSVYLAADNYVWLGHSIGCKYIALLESAGKLPEQDDALRAFVSEVLDPMPAKDAKRSKIVEKVVAELKVLREGLKLDAMTSRKLVSRCNAHSQKLLEQASIHPAYIYNDLFIRDQKSILLAPVASDTSSAVRPRALAEWIDNQGWGVKPSSAETKRLIKKTDLFHLLVLARFNSDNLACDTIQWFYQTLNRPEGSAREPFLGGHMRPLGFSLADQVINPGFDHPLITSATSRNQALEDRLDHQLQKLPA